MLPKNPDAPLPEHVYGSLEKLFLLAEFEMFGQRHVANVAEQTYQKQYAYYTSGAARIKYSHITPTQSRICWLRSRAVPNTAAMQYATVTTSGSWSSANGRLAYSISPCFCV